MLREKDVRTGIDKKDAKAIIGEETPLDSQPAKPAPSFTQKYFKWLYGNKVVMIGVHVDAQANEAVRLEGTVDLTGALCSPIEEGEVIKGDNEEEDGKGESKEEADKEETDKGESMEETLVVKPQGDWSEVDKPAVQPIEESATKEDSQQQPAGTGNQGPIHPLLSSSLSSANIRNH